MSITVNESGFGIGTRTTYRAGTIAPARPITRARPVTPAVAAAPARPVRLTARGRLAVVLVSLAAILAAVVVFGAAVAATDDPPAEQLATVTVQPGQTLWSIAAAARPDADIRQTVDEIIRLNALENGSKLPIGATLAVPVGD